MVADDNKKFVNISYRINFINIGMVKDEVEIKKCCIWSDVYAYQLLFLAIKQLKMTKKERTFKYTHA